MKKNILIFPCGSEIGLEIFSSVRYSTYFHLIGGSSVEDHGSYVYSDYVSGLPFANDPALIPALKRLVKERDIAAIYPTMDSVITALKGKEEEIGCLVIAPSAKTTEICLSKGKTYELLSDTIRTPRVFTKNCVKEYPVFLKPDVGYGANGTKVIYSAEELAAAVAENPEKLILEYLPGEEYTVDCFTDRHGVLRYCAARVRSRIKSGISVHTYFAENQAEFRPIVEKIGAVIPFQGAWFAQFKRDQAGKLCVMEIAARLGGASTLSRAVGVNFALLTLFDAFGFDVDVTPANYPVTLDRALANKFRADVSYDTVYVDYDDCLILEKTKVNTELVCFLYQCRNQGKKLLLLSKHTTPLMEELRQFRLSEVFDEVIQLERSDDKANYIADKNSIFIDDSFAERENIRRKCGIPVFSPEMVCVLMS